MVEDFDASVAELERKFPGKLKSGLQSPALQAIFFFGAGMNVNKYCDPNGGKCCYPVSEIRGTHLRNIFSLFNGEPFGTTNRVSQPSNSIAFVSYLIAPI